MASQYDAPSLMETAREQMQQLFKARVLPKAANEVNDGVSTSSTERLDLSPRDSLKDALNAEELLTFSTTQASAEAATSPGSASSSRGATAATDKDPEGSTSAADGDGWEGGDGMAAAPVEVAHHRGARHSTHRAVGPPKDTGCEPPHLESPASPRSLAEAWKLLLGSQHPGERAALLRGVEGISTKTLVTLALLSLMLGRGIAGATWIFRLCRDHACDIIAVFCFAMVAVKWVLRLMRSVASHVPKLRETATNMEASMQYVSDMHSDAHAMRTMMEKMLADFESKTTWIPTGVKPPAWLAGKKQ